MKKLNNKKSIIVSCLSLLFIFGAVNSEVVSEINLNDTGEIIRGESFQDIYEVKVNIETEVRSAYDLQSSGQRSYRMGEDAERRRLPSVPDKYQQIDLGRLEGEQINTLTGHPVHEITDFVWKGTGGLDIRITRRWDLPAVVPSRANDPDPDNDEDVRNAVSKPFFWYMDKGHVGELMGDWELKIPYISVGVGGPIQDNRNNIFLKNNTGMESNTYVGICKAPEATGDTCFIGQNDACNVSTIGGPILSKGDIWDGIKIHGLPQHEVKELLFSNGLITGARYQTLDNWKANCIKASIDDENGPVMNGFKVEATNGLTYYFEELRQLTLDNNFMVPNFVTVHRKSPKARIYLSKVEDVHGNTLTYNYDDPVGDNSFFGYIRSIVASDGRTIEFNYETADDGNGLSYGDTEKFITSNGGTVDVNFYYKSVAARSRITRVRAKNANENGTDRVWKYDYNDSTNRLTSVEYPNGQTWGYSREFRETGQYNEGQLIFSDELEFTYPEKGKLKYRLGNFILKTQYDGKHPYIPSQNLIINQFSPVLAVGKRQIFADPEDQNYEEWKYYYGQETFLHSGSSNGTQDPERKIYEYRFIEVGPTDITYVKSRGDLISLYDKSPSVTSKMALPSNSPPDPFSTNSQDLNDFVNLINSELDAGKYHSVYRNVYSAVPYGVISNPILVGANCLRGTGYSTLFENGTFKDCPFSNPRSSRIRVVSIGEVYSIKEDPESPNFSQYVKNYIPDFTATQTNLDWHYLRPNLILDIEHSERSLFEDINSDLYVKCTKLAYKDLSNPWILGLNKRSETWVGKYNEPTNNYSLMNECSNSNQLAAIVSGTEEYEPISQERTFNNKGQVMTESVNNRNPQIIAYKNDGSGLIDTITDPLGKVTEYKDYYRGNPKKITKKATDVENDLIINRTYTPTGLLASEKDAMGNTTDFTYDQAGKLATVDYPVQADISIDWNYSTSPITKTIEREDSESTYFRRIESYDGFGRLISTEETDPDNTDVDPVIIKREYNAKGMLTFKSYPYALDDSSPEGVKMEFDLLNRPTKTYRTVDQSNKKITEYLANEIIKQTDERGFVTTSKYRVFGLDTDNRELLYVETPVVIDETDCEQNQTLVTKFIKDVQGANRKVSRGCKGVEESFITQEYEFNNKLLPESSLIPEISKLQNYGYNDLGQIISDNFTGISNSSVSYIYDEFNRLESINYSDISTEDVSMGYDKNGNLKSISNGLPTIKYKYNELDQVEHKELQIDGMFLKLDYSYSESGGIESITYPSGFILEFNPDGFGRPTTVGEFVTSANYYANGELSSVIYGNGQEAIFTLNNKRLIEDIIVSNDTASQVAVDQAYTYDSTLNIETLTDSLNDENNRIMTFDALNRLTSVEYTTVDFNGEYKYDSKGNMTVKNDLLGSLTFEYPDRLSTNRLGSVSGYVTESYTYNDYGAISGDGTNGYIYDRVGNLVSMTGSASTGSVNHVYDAEKRRVKSDTNGVIIYRMYDGNQLMFEYNSTNNWFKEHYYLGDKLIATREFEDPSETDIDENGVTDLGELYISVH
ncbi:MAG: hypothetical protein ACK5L8_04940 [Marinicella pacifica]